MMIVLQNSPDTADCGRRQSRYIYFIFAAYIQKKLCKISEKIEEYRGVYFYFWGLPPPFLGCLQKNSHQFFQKGVQCYHFKKHRK